MDSAGIQIRLDQARARLSAARVVTDKAAAKASNATFGGSDDPAVLSGIRRKPNPKADERRWNAYSRAAKEQVHLDALEDHVRVLEQRFAIAVREEQRQLYSSADLTGATHVQDEYGWHKVIRVNAKSVSVETGYSWADGISISDVRAYRKENPL